MSPPIVSAAQRQPVPVTPIWLMRQAGRCLPAYRKLRERYSFTELTDDPELITQVTLMPFEAAGLDAAIIFADMMTPVPALGIDYKIVENTGPVVEVPIRTKEQIDGLVIQPISEVAHAVFEGIRLTSKALPPEVGLIGFGGAPFTLASYLIEGRPNRDFPQTRRLMADKQTWASLMDVLCRLISTYLNEQIAAGAQMVQLFDSWAGSLTRDEYVNAVLPYTRRVVDSLKSSGVPRIHFATNTRHLLSDIATLDCEVVSVFNDIGLDEAWDLVGDSAIQGNLDPVALAGPREGLVAAARDVLARANGRPGHIFNLGHGVLPDTPTDNLKALVDLVHEEGHR